MQEVKFVLEILLVAELQVLLAHFEFLECLDGELEGGVVEEKHCSFPLVAAGRFRQLHVDLADVVVNEGAGAALPDQQQDYQFYQHMQVGTLGPYSRIKLGKQRYFGEGCREAVAALCDGAIYVLEVVTILLCQAEVQVLEQTLVEGIFEVLALSLVAGPRILVL